MPESHSGPIEQRRAGEGPRPGQLSALLQELVRPAQEGAGPGWERAPTPGTVVGRFELLREIGRGAFGVVYEALDRELGRRVAFKAVRPGARPDLTEHRLLREAEAAAQLSHPNIVTLFDVGRSESGPYLVLELLEGETLAGRLRGGRLAVREAVHVAAEVARALAHAHAHGVVHRDLKPANVFLCTDGRVKVLDFGLAHAFGHRREPGGTPGYMPPEQSEGAPEDERSDVWALGVIVFEMLSGRLPFADERSLARPAPALDVPGCPGLRELIGRMIANRPVDRPRDGADVLADIERIERELPATAAPAAPVRIRRRLAPRWLVGVSLVLALVVTGAVVAIVNQRAGHPSPGGSASIAVLAFADLSPQKDQEYLGDGMAEEILSALSRVRGLRVIGRTSSFSFKGKSDDLRTIGQKLNVATVLEGSVRRVGQRVRIATKLVRSQDGSTLWADTFDRNDMDLFATQDEIARSVAAALRVKLLQDDAQPVAMRTAVSDAHLELLRGRRLANQGVPQAHHAAIQAFERALRLDPEFAPAYCALSIALFNLALPYDEERGDVLTRARALVERAIALAPTFAEPYAVRAVQRSIVDYDWDGARADLDRALALAPNDLRARFSHAQLMATLGHIDRGIEELQSIVRDDPLSAPPQNTLAKLYLASSRSADARRVLNRVLELEPRGNAELFTLAQIELEDGHPAEALGIAERLDIEWFRRLIVGMAQHDLGHEGEAQEQLAWFERRAGDQCSRLSCGALADLYAYRGEPDAALQWLERAYASREPGVGELKRDATFRKLRDHPRFRDLLRRMNLPVD